MHNSPTYCLHESSSPTSVHRPSPGRTYGVRRALRWEVRLLAVLRAVLVSASLGESQSLTLPMSMKIFGGIGRYNLGKEGSEIEVERRIHVSVLGMYLHPLAPVDREAPGDHAHSLDKPLARQVETCWGECVALARQGQNIPSKKPTTWDENAARNPPRLQTQRPCRNGLYPDSSRFSTIGSRSW
nr:hypothetical protein CFP56_12090 [Quercus suber]